MSFDFGTPQRPGDHRDLGGEEYLRNFLNGEAMIVDSSMVYAARYDRAAQILYLTWAVTMETSSYGPVSEGLAVSFAQAPSKGTWVHNVIKAGYQADGRHWVHAVPKLG